MTAQIASIGFSRFGSRTESGVELAAEAGLRAMEPLGRKPIDLLIVGNMLAGPLEGQGSLVPRIAGRLGIETASGFRLEAASATGAAAFHSAVYALASGHHDRALVVAFEKMTGHPTPEVTRCLSGSLHPSEFAAGATMPALASLLAQCYARRYSLGPEAFDLVTVHARAQALHNPNAQFHGAVTPEEVRASRPIALPLRLLHCAAISDGAVAIVLERGAGPAAVLGVGQSLEQFRVVDRASLTSFGATRQAAQRAYESSHRSPGDVGTVETHDAFAPFALMGLEDLGLIDPGESARWFSEGWIRPGERLPVNVSGGLLGRGHPVGATGLASIAEIGLQLRGEAEGHQLSTIPRVGLAHSIGGLASQNFVTILGAQAP